MDHISELSAHTAPPAFKGLRPRRAPAPVEVVGRSDLARDVNRVARSLFATVPIVLVGSLAMTGLGLGDAPEPIDGKPKAKSVTSDAAAATAVRDALGAANMAVVAEVAILPQGALAAASVPTTYTVESGDTVSGIAGKFGLSTASVLALNGLGWKTSIFPGQVLQLASSASPAAAPSAARPAAASVGLSAVRYTIEKGDTVGGIAGKFGTTISAILAANGLGQTSVIYAGRTLNIPGAPATAAVAITPVASAAAGGTYTIKSGDTISAIARTFGITVPDLLSINGLTRTSIIYSGRTLTVTAPLAVKPAVFIQPAQTGDTVTPLSDEMRSNARVIIGVGRDLGVPDYGIIVALAAAMQESSLRNIGHGDRDSVGLFQQRPSAHWGEPKRLLDATHAARLFFGGPSNPNAGVTAGLLDFSNWRSLSVTEAAQKVQISAHPNAYAKWETSARSWLSTLG